MLTDDGKKGGLAVDTPLAPAKGGRLVAIALAGVGTLALGVVGSFVYAAWSGQRRFDTWPTIVLYYVVPTAMAALFFASLRFKSSSRLRLLMLVVSLAVSVYAGELVLFVFDGTHIRPFAALDGHPQLRPAMSELAISRDKTQYAANLIRTSGGPIDVRTSREMLDDLRRQGQDAIPIVTPSNHLFIPQSDGSIKSAITIDGREVLPLAAVSERLTLLCNEGGQWIYYRSDRRGFNNPDRVWDSAAVDIAAVGDSFTHGYCVPQDKNFVALIRDRDRATVNLGIAGNGPLLMLATLTDLAASLSPKIVLWCYYEGNDLTDLQTERKSALLERYMTAGFSQPDLRRQREIDRAILAEIPRLVTIEQENEKRRAQDSTIWNSTIYSLSAVAKLTALRDRLGLFDGTDPMALRTADDFATANMAAFREVLRQAKMRVNGWRGQLYFVYLPEWTRYTSYSSWGKSKRDDVLDLVRSLGIPLIDLAPVFQAHGDPLSLFPFRAVGHYTEAGHRLVADEVLRRIASSGRLGAP